MKLGISLTPLSHKIHSIIEFRKKNEGRWVIQYKDGAYEEDRIGSGWPTDELWEAKTFATFEEAELYSEVLMDVDRIVPI